MNYKELKRKLAALGIAVAIGTTYCAVDTSYTPQYEILSDSMAFAECPCGLVYIGDKEFLESIPRGDRVILIEDQRFSRDDPNMKIYNSCQIRDKNDRNDILEVIQEYERCNPSPWDRSIESMRLEWFMHNISYDCSYKQNRTEDVDLDNLDEEKYDNKILRKILKV